MGGMIEAFDTPLRSAALGVLIVAAITLARGLILAHPYRASVLILTSLALAMILVSEALR